MSDAVGIGWSEKHTATGKHREAMRNRGRPMPSADPCACCQGYRRVIETIGGGMQQVWVVCRWCDVEEKK